MLAQAGAAAGVVSIQGTGVVSKQGTVVVSILWFLYRGGCAECVAATGEGSTLH
jgi:hypothetical protein